MGYLEEMAKYHKTERQKAFGYDFLQGAEKYEVWDEIQVGSEAVSPITFEVKAEDLKAYAEGVPDANPLFHDEEYAKKSPYGQLVAHPIFTTMILFWCLQRGHGTWIRTPGSGNPGQILEWYEPIRVGDVITLKTTAYDKWIKRGKYYMRYQVDFIDQNQRLKARQWVTLILPKTREDLLKFQKGEHALEI